MTDAQLDELVEYEQQGGFPLKNGENLYATRLA